MLGLKKFAAYECRPYRFIQIQDILTKTKQTGLFIVGASASLRTFSDVSKADCVCEYTTFNALTVVKFRRIVKFRNDTVYCFDSNAHTAEN